MHKLEHPYKGQFAHVKYGVMKFGGKQCYIIDWWDLFNGVSWKQTTGNIIAFHYSIRRCYVNLPLDDQVVAISIKGTQYLVHNSELDFTGVEKIR